MKAKRINRLTKIKDHSHFAYASQRMSARRMRRARETVMKRRMERRYRGGRVGVDRLRLICIVQENYNFLSACCIVCQFII